MRSNLCGQGQLFCLRREDCWQSACILASARAAEAPYCCYLHIRRSALNAVLTIADKHRQAEERAARAATSAQHVREVPLNQTYHADPLNLSPLAALSHVYVFVEDARRMVTGGMGSGGGSEVGQAEGSASITAQTYIYTSSWPVVTGVCE